MAENVKFLAGMVCLAGNKDVMVNFDKKLQGLEMAKFKYLDIDCAAWIADTHHLSIQARGLYMDMIILCWMSPDCKLPNDIPHLTKLLGCKNKIEKAQLGQIVAGFWKPDRYGRWLHQKRLDKEWQASRLRREQSLVNNKSRWNKEKTPLRTPRTETGTALGNSFKRNSSNAVPRARARASLGATRDPPREKENDRVQALREQAEAQAMFARQLASLEPADDDNDQTKH